MRKLLMLFVLAVTLLGVSSCSLHDPMVQNVNQTTTNVVMTENNFKIVEKVRGEAQADYIFYFGGFRKQALIEEARANMLENANLIGTSKAVINENVEMSVTSFAGIYTYLKVTVSGYVIEFTE